ncbi:hypothetical protein F5Y04DRAFT_292682 [Hypomontagnella monticulosa]|nr:hypothetical protein F5Y04DRAFT_292682 [Hypomontagnella monticulosa]
MDNTRNLRPRPGKALGSGSRKRRPGTPPSGASQAKRRKANHGEDDENEVEEEEDLEIEDDEEEIEEEEEEEGHDENHQEEDADDPESDLGGGNPGVGVDEEMDSEWGGEDEENDSQADEGSETQEVLEVEEIPQQAGRGNKGRAGRGRRSKKWASFEKEVVAGAENTPGSLLPRAAQQTWKFEKDFQDSRDWLVAKRRRTRKIEELEAKLPGPGIDQLWTQEKEDELTATFDASALKAYAGRRARVHDHFFTLWKKAYQLRRVFPTDVIGARQYLEYEGRARLSNGQVISNPNWTRQFCEELDFLIVSSPCGDDMDLLATFIRYEVACRTDDRRPVPLDLSRRRSGFLQLMEDKIKAAHGARDLIDIGREARRQWIDDGMKLPWEALMMEQIELLAFIDREEEDDEDEDEEVVDEEDEDEDEDGDDDEERDDDEEEEEEEMRPPPLSYSVGVRDLRTVKKAFSGIINLGIPMFRDVNDVFALASTARATHGGSPKDWAELIRLRIPLLKAEMRILEKRRLAEVDEEDAAADDDDGDDEDDDVFGSPVRPPGGGSAASAPLGDQGGLGAAGADADVDSDLGGDDDVPMGFDSPLEYVSEEEEEWAGFGSPSEDEEEWAGFDSSSENEEEWSGFGNDED